MTFPAAKDWRAFMVEYRRLSFSIQDDAGRLKGAINPFAFRHSSS